MNTRDVPLRLKGIEDSGRFTGTAAVYGVRDFQGDIIERGAFRHAVNRQGGGYPLLWSHKQDTPIGLARIEDSPEALIVHGEIDKGDPDGATAYQRIRRGVVRGLSIGFTIPPDPNAVFYLGDTRHLRQITLHEISLVSVPAQPGAEVVSVKTIEAARQFIEGLRGELDEGILAEVKAIRRHLDTVIPQDQPSGDAMLDELRRFARELRF